MEKVLDKNEKKCGYGFQKTSHSFFHKKSDEKNINFFCVEMLQLFTIIHPICTQYGFPAKAIKSGTRSTIYTPV